MKHRALDSALDVIQCWYKEREHYENHKEQIFAWAGGKEKEIIE